MGREDTQEAGDKRIRPMTETLQTICRACHAQCTLRVQRGPDGRIGDAHGDPNDPVYHGYSCIKGRTLASYHTVPTRLLTSMRKTASGGHVPIASDAAIREIAQRLRAIVDAHGPRSVALYIGTFGYNNFTAQGFALAFMAAIGSPMVFTSVTIDQPGKGVALALHGPWLAGTPPMHEWDALLLVGSNPIVSMNGGLGMNPAKALKDAKARGMGLVVIDPRRTESAKHADVHLQGRPGEDPAILAGIARVLITEHLIDAEFIQAETSGFAALQAAVMPFTPEVVAARAGISAAALIDAARIYGTARRGAVSAGTGPNMSGHGNLVEYFVRVLTTLKGNWQRAGETKSNPGVLIAPGPAIAASPGPFPAFGYGERLRVRDLGESPSGLPTAALAEEILTPGEGRVRALLVLGGNPMAAWPDQLKTFAAMQALDLLVCFDPKLSGTGRLADFVIAPTLPFEVEGNTALNELLGNFGPGWGYEVAYAHYTPAIAPPPPGADVVEEWSVFHGLARALDLTLAVKPFALLDPAAATAAATLVRPGDQLTSSEAWDIILAGSPVPLAEVRRHRGGRVFDRPPVVVQSKPDGWSGRLDIGNPYVLAELDASGRPTAEPEGFPFRVISRRLHDMHNSNWHDVTAQQRRWAYNPAFMHPEDLRALGIAGGEAIVLESARASIQVVAASAPDVRPGCISVSHGWGRNPDEPEDPFRDGGNTGRLSSTDRDYDPITGIPLMSAIPVRVRRARGTRDERG
ncbi:MAG: molybdopterin dinucleotide-binding protein [Deltaproteobacteria bacterium]|nr:molybdopterin dinucleotide-binding protein [Deltaproteobacteria bacterium]